MSIATEDIRRSVRISEKTHALLKEAHKESTYREERRAYRAECQTWARESEVWSDMCDEKDEAGVERSEKLRIWARGVWEEKRAKWEKAKTAWERAQEKYKLYKNPAYKRYENPTPNGGSSYAYSQSVGLSGRTRRRREKEMR